MKCFILFFLEASLNIYMRIFLSIDHFILHYREIKIKILRIRKRSDKWDKSLDTVADCE